MGKLENLKSVSWINSQPSIMPISAAKALNHELHHFYMVNWWNDEPAGFSRFEFTGTISVAYEIKITSESGECFKGLEADEWALAFQQY